MQGINLVNTSNPATTSNNNTQTVNNSCSSFHINNHNQTTPHLVSNTSLNLINTSNNNFQISHQFQTYNQQHSSIMGPEQCQGCLGLINDRYYLQVMNKAWHLNCLRCCECKSSLDSQQTCFAKDGLIYCKDDYFKYEVYFLFFSFFLEKSTDIENKKVCHCETEKKRKCN
jgi:hypothetical protein